MKLREGEELIVVCVDKTTAKAKKEKKPKIVVE